MLWASSTIGGGDLPRLLCCYISCAFLFINETICDYLSIPAFMLLSKCDCLRRYWAETPSSALYLPGFSYYRRGLCPVKFNGPGFISDFVLLWKMFALFFIVNSFDCIPFWYYCSGSPGVSPFGVWLSSFCMMRAILYSSSFSRALSSFISSYFFSASAMS